MLTLLITANQNCENIAKNHLELIKKIGTIEREFEVVFLAKSNFEKLYELKYLSANVINHYLLIAEPRTTDDEMVQMGLEFAEGNDVLLCTLDTIPDVLHKVLEKRNDERKIVYVRRKINKFSTFFKNIGIWAYNLGLKMLGKNSDNFAEVRIQYFDGKIANSLAENISNNRELRITHSFKQVRTGVVEQPKLYFDESKKTSKENNMVALGAVSFIYILALLALVIIYPCFHNMTYSWWMIIVLVAWITFGILAIITASKKIFRSRCSVPLRANNFGERVYDIIEMVKFGDTLKTELIFPKQAIIKNKIKLKSIKKSKPKATAVIKKVNIKLNGVKTPKTKKVKNKGE